ncbi:uncharacterized protein Bfra_004288 [Botrytis fragariae]|uniref:Uncharacterized protein n=1 Tax=Botrytis fragariae TaxID=1964551 RepID=A0A8H6AV82_9HELO|nr:uncharacterized protein Bfra_004288 [Botrytis fragariae]KAF5874282.1 hypothetical protein Bfra_004288 [Botrytis fragariae]
MAGLFNALVVSRQHRLNDDIKYPIIKRIPMKWTRCPVSMVRDSGNYHREPAYLLSLNNAHSEQVDHHDKTRCSLQY